MALITKPNTFSAGATVIASEHNDNFDTIYNDHNGGISNANLDASAAIVDTKLAQITTANKVAATAVQDKFLRNDGNDTTSGTITADGFTTAAGTVSTANLTVDGVVSIDGVVSMFGTVASRSDNTVYLAETDGIFYGSSDFSANENGDVFSDSSNPPTTVRQSIGVMTGGDTGITGHSFSIPVKSGEYYKANLSAGDNPLLWWMPIG